VISKNIIKLDKQKGLFLRRELYRKHDVVLHPKILLPSKEHTLPPNPT